MQMQPIGTADVISMQGSSWPQSIVAIFLDVDGKPVDLTGCTPRIFAGPSGAYNDGAVMDAFSGIAKFDVTPDMTASPGEYACSFSLPNTAVPDFKVDRLTLRVVLQQDGIYFAFLNQAPGSGDIQTQIDNIKTELSSKITEQDVQTAINGVQIGGVQLLLDSATLPTLHGWSESENTDAEDQGNGYYRLPLNTDVTEILQNKNVDTIHGATYTESFYFKTDSTTLGFSFDFFETNNTAEHIVQATIQNLGGGLYRAYATATVGDTSIRAIDIKDLVYTDGTYIDIAKPKFEIGTKPTDYCLADADQQAYTDGKVSAVSTTITQQQSQINQNASEIALRVEKSVYDTDMAGKANKATIISEINQSAEEISINAEKLNLNGYVTFNNLNVGGANLLLNSNFSNGLKNISTNLNGIISVITDDTFGYAIKGVTSKAYAGVYMRPQGRIANQKYTWGAWMKADSNCTFTVIHEDSDNVTATISLTTSWQYFHGTGTWNGSGGALCFYSSPSEPSVTFYLANVKYEEGNIPTAWTPYPDLSVDGATFINGDNIDTNTLKVQKIYDTTSNYYAKIGELSLQTQDGTQTGTGIGLYSNGNLLSTLYSSYHHGSGESGDYDNMYYSTIISTQNGSGPYIAISKQSGKRLYGITLGTEENTNGTNTPITGSSIGIDGGADNSAPEIYLEVFLNGIEKAGLYLDTTHGVKCYNEDWDDGSTMRHWHKYPDGTVHQWGRIDVAMSITVGMGSVYRFHDYSFGLQVALVGPATCTMNIYVTGANAWASGINVQDGNSIHYDVFSPTSFSNAHTEHYYDIWGRWK